MCPFVKTMFLAWLSTLYLQLVNTDNTVQSRGRRVGREHYESGRVNVTSM